MRKEEHAGAALQKGKARSSFSGKLGYVLAVAGSAVGLGNIWRFPYLVEQSSAFHRKKMYGFFMRYLAPVCIIIILFSSIAGVLGWITM